MTYSPLIKADGIINNPDRKHLAYYIYAYINPFKKLDKPVKVEINGKQYIFMYEVFYIGKAVSNSAYRMNQHLAEYLQNKNRLKDKAKYNTFTSIKVNMNKLKKTDEDVIKYDLPLTWENYKNNWIIILDKLEYDPLEDKTKTKKKLEELEKIWINKLKKYFKLDNFLLNR